jgi:hypothetical protein
LSGAERTEGGDAPERRAQVSLEEFREEAIEKQEELDAMEQKVKPAEGPAALYAEPEEVLTDVRPQQAEPKTEAATAEDVEGFRQDIVERSAESEVGGYHPPERPVEVPQQEDSPRRGDDVQNEVKTDDLQRLPREAEAEPEAPETRMLEAVDYGKGAVLRVPKTDLEEAGYETEKDRNGIVELGLREEGSEDIETVFARYNASDRRAEVYVGDIEGAKGSRYEVVEAKEYDEDRLVRDFERGKCEHLENVRLEHTDGRMFVNVDDRRVELEEYRLSTSGSHVIMRGKLDGEDNCKIEFDGRRTSVRFGRDYPVEEMRREEDELVVRYVQSKNEKHEKRLYLEHVEEPEKPSLNRLDSQEMRESVKAFDHPNRIEGAYQFTMNQLMQNEMQRLLDDAMKRRENEYDVVKGEIGERLVPNLLELAGWERIKRHPFNETRKDGASANGSDWLVRTPDRKIALMEVKWYKDSEDAIRKATSQIADDFREHKKCMGMKIEAAYIAVMEWDVDDRPAKVFIKRVRPLEELT